MQTRRQLIEAALERRPSMQPTEIAMMLRDHDIGLSPAQAVEEVQEIANGSNVLVAPPSCVSCGFDEFDTPANLPSRCPACRSERLAEPEFTIRAPDE